MSVEQLREAVMRMYAYMDRCGYTDRSALYLHCHPDLADLVKLTECTAPERVVLDERLDPGHIYLTGQPVLWEEGL